ncbi:MAG: hypothetical protein V1685_00020 [Parcubacteria group bacterium]
MQQKKRQRVAMLSVFHKKGIIRFARSLVRRGFLILASGGTAKHLKKAGVPVTDTAEFLGAAYARLFDRISREHDHIVPRRVLNAIRREIGSAILGHRVVTLDQRLYGGVLARDIQQDLDDLAKICAEWIDLVCIDFYPFDRVAAKPGVTRDELIEMIDIGGPGLVKAGAKGGRIVICDPKDRSRVLRALRRHGDVPDALRRELVDKAFFEVTKYYLSVAHHLSGGKYDGMLGVLHTVCKYGENPHQTPAGFYSTESGDSLGLDAFKLIAGSLPSYVNFTDYQRALQGISHVREGFRVNGLRARYIVIIYKHGNPCGAAYGNSKTDVIRRAIDGNPRAATGGIVVANFTIGIEEARILRTRGIKKNKRGLDGVLAPAVTPEAVKVLKRPQGMCRVFTNRALRTPSLDRSIIRHTVRGGFLRQPNFEYVFRYKHPKTEVHGRLTTQQRSDLVFAWALCATSTSNTITLVKNRMLIGNGTGQDDRVGAAQLALRKARQHRHSTKGAVSWSDSFFPFVDGVRVLVLAGIVVIGTCSGSVMKGGGDAAVKKFLLRRKVTLVWVPVMVGRNFFGHC